MKVHVLHPNLTLDGGRRRVGPGPRPCPAQRCLCSDPSAGPRVALLFDNKNRMWSPQCDDGKRIKVQQYKPRLSA